MSLGVDELVAYEPEPEVRGPGASDHAIALARLAATVAADKKAEQIVALDVAQRFGLSDVFLLVSAANERQVGAVAEAIEEQLWRAGAKAQREGDREARWVLLDADDLVVHIQHRETRTLFALDRLWYDCPVIPLDQPRIA